ncbi:hypothetical protein IC575_022228 [Cucumis melo]
MKAAFIPKVNDELNTQNFEKFEEVENEIQISSKSCPWRKVVESKFVFEAKFIQVIEFLASLS